MRQWYPVLLTCTVVFVLGIWLGVSLPRDDRPPWPPHPSVSFMAPVVMRQFPDKTTVFCTHSDVGIAQQRCAQFGESRNEMILLPADHVPPPQRGTTEWKNDSYQRCRKAPPFRAGI